MVISSGPRRTRTPRRGIGGSNFSPFSGGASTQRRRRYRGNRTAEERRYVWRYDVNAIPVTGHSRALRNTPCCCTARRPSSTERRAAARFYSKNNVSTVFFYCQTPNNNSAATESRVRKMCVSYERGRRPRNGPEYASHGPRKLCPTNTLIIIQRAHALRGIIGRGTLLFGHLNIRTT